VRASADEITFKLASLAPEGEEHNSGWFAFASIKINCLGVLSAHAIPSQLIPVPVIGKLF